MSTTVVTATVIILSLVNLVLLAILLIRGRTTIGADVVRMSRDELRQGREETAKTARELRDELAQRSATSTETLLKAVSDHGQSQNQQLDGFAEQLRGFTESTQGRFDALRTAVESQLGQAGEAYRTSFGLLEKAVNEKLVVIRESTEKSSDAIREGMETRLKANQEQDAKAARDLREELTSSLKGNTDSLVKATGEMGGSQKAALDTFASQLKGLGDTMQVRFDALRGVVDGQLKQIQESNAKKLDEIRKTVDEQLQGALDKKLTESFKLVGGQLEAVQRGLGEMQALATGVGDLKKVLTNVKVRGTWAEVQLGSILEQMLTPDQYAKNVQTRENSREHVEFAIRFPGLDGDPNSCVWLPIDSKFPQEAYNRLLEASDKADPERVQAAVAELSQTIRKCAADIRDKYLAPPQTTDFGILFLPTEGLYAEILRQPGLSTELQHKYKVLIAGPTTLAALLSSFQMGFRTLAIGKRVAEVWNVLGAVKTEFGKFGDVLTKLKKQLNTAVGTVDDTETRTRAMERCLREVERLPSAAAIETLALPPPIATVDHAVEISTGVTTS